MVSQQELERETPYRALRPTWFPSDVQEHLVRSKDGAWPPGLASYGEMNYRGYYVPKSRAWDPLRDDICELLAVGGVWMDVIVVLDLGAEEEPHTGIPAQRHAGKSKVRGVDADRWRTEAESSLCDRDDSYVSWVEDWDGRRLRFMIGGLHPFRDLERVADSLRPISSEDEASKA